MLVYFSLRYPFGHSNVSIERWRETARYQLLNSFLIWTIFSNTFPWLLWVRTLFTIWQNNNNDDDGDEDNNNNYYYYKNNDDIINNNVKVKAQLAWRYVTPSR